MPELLTNVLAEHTYDPVSFCVNRFLEQRVYSCLKRWQAPISTTVRKCASNFKKTHQDTWHEDSKRFTEEQLSALSTLLTGSSYCKDSSGFRHQIGTDRVHQMRNDPHNAVLSLHIVIRLYLDDGNLEWHKRCEKRGNVDLP